MRNLQREASEKSTRKAPPPMTVKDKSSNGLCVKMKKMGN